MMKVSLKRLTITGHIEKEARKGKATNNLTKLSKWLAEETLEDITKRYNLLRAANIRRL